MKKTLKFSSLATIFAMGMTSIASAQVQYGAVDNRNNPMNTPLGTVESTYPKSPVYTQTGVVVSTGTLVTTTGTGTIYTDNAIGKEIWKQLHCSMLARGFVWNSPADFYANANACGVSGGSSTLGIANPTLLAQRQMVLDYIANLKNAPIRDTQKNINEVKKLMELNQCLWASEKNSNNSSTVLSALEWIKKAHQDCYSRYTELSDDTKIMIASNIFLNSYESQTLMNLTEKENLTFFQPFFHLKNTRGKNNIASIDFPKNIYIQKGVSQVISLDPVYHFFNLDAPDDTQIQLENNPVWVTLEKGAIMIRYDKENSVLNKPEFTVTFTDKITGQQIKKTANIVLAEPKILKTIDMLNAEDFGKEIKIDDNMSWMLVSHGSKYTGKATIRLEIIDNEPRFNVYNEKSEKVGEVYVDIHQQWGGGQLPILDQYYQ